MRYDFSDDPYYQTAKEEKAEMERLEALQDEAREARDYEFWREREDARVEAKYGEAFETEMDAEDRLSECDCCGKMKYGCEDCIAPGGMDTHACPECRGESKY